MGGADERRRKAARDGLSRASSEGAVRGAAPAFLALAAAIGMIGGAAAWFGVHPVLTMLHAALYAFFFLVTAARLALPLIGADMATPPPLPVELPWYTVIVPLRDEAAMAAQIVSNLGRLNYPPDRMQILFVLEADDVETATALRAAGPPVHMHILVCPPGDPATKPRACNLALSHAIGEIVVIYDAEDQPDRLQLIEAAARFSRAPADLGCLQAPLRVVERDVPLQRQFALEYAALFDVVLPALSRLGLPFPLGGTSNHFRRAALDQVGGWDAFNVTEDADIGFRLARHGWRLGMLQAPTWEEAPESLHAWLPQRCRWLKGYAQTWSVIMRRPFAGGLKVFFGLQSTLGLSMLSSLAHGPLALLTAASGLVALLDLKAGLVMGADATLLIYAWSSAAIVMAIGARRAGFRMTWRDALTAGGYWPAQSLAAGYALQQLVTAPFQWDKTPHNPKPPVKDLPPVVAGALDERPPRWLTRVA